jgi:hypothetical protein
VRVEDNGDSCINETGCFRLVGREGRGEEHAMKRRWLALLSLGLLSGFMGCHITTGVCDCDGIPDPCGGPPLPFNAPVPTPGGGGEDAPLPAHPAAVPLLGPGFQQGPYVPNPAAMPGGTIIQQTPINAPPGTTVLTPSLPKD